MKVPILFIIFNRLDTAQKVFEEIRKYRPSHLYLASDGPRDKGAEKEVCENIRSWVLDNIDWECDLKTLFQDDNLGCGRGPSTAITWFFEHVEEGIILEDDCVAHPDFFIYCEELLDFYRNDERISIISGCNFDLKKEFLRKESYFYSVFPYTWGWATWKRNWNDYDYTISEWKKINQKDLLLYLFKEKQYHLTWKLLFDKISKNPPKDIWDYQFFYRCFIKKQLSILPTVNLISNIGFGDMATHDFSHDNLKVNIELEAMKFPIKHPSEIIRNHQYDIFLQELNYGVIEQVPFQKKIKRFIRKQIKSVLKK